MRSSGTSRPPPASFTRLWTRVWPQRSSQPARELKAVANIESDDEWFTDRLPNLEPESVVDYEMFDPRGIGTVDEMLRAGDPIDKVFLDFRDLDPEAATAAVAAIKSAFGKRATVIESKTHVVDVVSVDASKASMAQQLARRMQVPAEQIMAIGDDDSDAALLQWAGIGVAMGNATPSCKGAADMITSSNLRDGVAEALEQWILGGKSAGSGRRSPSPKQSRSRAGSGASRGAANGLRGYRIDQRVTPKKAR